MSANEWLVLYVGGLVVTAFGVATGREGVSCECGPLGRAVAQSLFIILWPIHLPASFVVLFATLCYWGLRLSLWIIRKMGGTFSVLGRIVDLD